MSSATTLSTPQNQVSILLVKMLLSWRWMSTVRKITWWIMWWNYFFPLNFNKKWVKWFHYQVLPKCKYTLNTLKLQKGLAKWKTLDLCVLNTPNCYKWSSQFISKGRFFDSTSGWRERLRSYGSTCCTTTWYVYLGID